jgi:uncharacterized protein (TIGR04141 family)
MRVPRKPSPASRTSLYRLTRVTTLADGVQPKYLEGDFTSVNLAISGREALLILGSISTPTVSWAAAVQGLTGRPVTLGNVTAAAVLLIRAAGPGGAASRDDGDDADDLDVTWALTYGMGFQLLDPARIDNGFGQRIAIRTADPKELNSLTRTTLDQRARTERSTIPGGDSLRGFGAGDFGELVTRLVAKAEIPSLTAGSKPIRIRGADALSLPLGKTPEQLVKDLDVLDEILHATPPLPELAVLEQLVALKDPEIIDRLEQALDEALGSPDGKRLGLSWPHERIDENGTPTSFKVYGLGHQAAAPQDGLPALETFLEPLADAAAGERVERLKKIKVMLYRDADATDSMSNLIPGLRWIAFETDADGRRYCLHDGHWYLMNQQYAERLRQQAQRIFDRDPGLALPDWPAGQHEDEYNKLAAHATGGLCLDRTPMTSDLHRHGIEVCDVLAPDGALIHVKDLSSSAPASHLLAQALVSAEALLFDQSAQQQFRKKITDCGWDPAQLPAKPQKVVLGVARKGKEVTAENLFTFTQVTLVRQDQALAARGVEVVIAPITREG